MEKSRQPVWYRQVNNPNVNNPAPGEGRAPIEATIIGCVAGTQRSYVLGKVLAVDGGARARPSAKG